MRIEAVILGDQSVVKNAVTQLLHAKALAHFVQQFSMFANVVDAEEGKEEVPERSTEALTPQCWRITHIT